MLAPPPTPLPKIVSLFLAGAAITSLFSASLFRLTTGVSFATVLAVGMIVPSFTWVVHLVASAVLLKNPARQNYQAALAKICLLGSAALLPAAVVNICLPNAPRWFSIANVLASVLIMAIDLFRRTSLQRLSLLWPTTWCLTIAANIAIFLAVSRTWWN